MDNQAKTVVDLIRHGEPVGGHIYRGHTIDDPLSEKGWAQMRAAVEGIAGWDVIVSSPLLRCRAFAEELAARLSIPLEIEAQFKEVGFGMREGLTPDEVIATRGSEYVSFYSDPVSMRPEGAEDLDAFIARVSNAYDALIARYAGKCVLVVSHAGVMRAVIAHVLGAPPAAMYCIQINNAGGARIQHAAHGPRLQMLNALLGDVST